MDTRELARQIRLDVLRMTGRSGASHVGSAFSVADILAVLYGAPILRVRPREPRWEGRDRFILSKGHAGAAVYAVLARSGFFPVEKLDTHYQDGSDLSGHVSHRNMPGVELSTGSLGHGLGVGAGMALVLRDAPGCPRAFVVLSDGECDEGSTWEAAMFAAHHRLENLVAIVDYNKVQSLGTVADTLALEPFADKWAAFNWDVIEADGHDHARLREALERAPAGRPRVVLAHTTKGKGVSFMEGSVLWHYRAARGEEFENALRELEARGDA
jgi:transketolase